MAIVQAYNLSIGEVHLMCEDGVMPPSPYSLFLASHVPNLAGAVVADVGTGSGIQAIIARRRGAEVVYLTDTNHAALNVAMNNAARNGVSSGCIPLQGSVLAPLPLGILLDCVICNPASLPMPTPEDEHSPYYSGPDGRAMIEQLVHEAAPRLREGGQLLMVHTSLADWPATETLLLTKGFFPRIVDQARLVFRPFYNRDWIDSLNGLKRGLYTVLDGQPIETLNVVVAEYLPGRQLVGNPAVSSVGAR